MRFFSFIPRYLIALVLTICAYGVYGKFLAPHLVGESTIVKAAPEVPFEHRPAELMKTDLAEYFPKNGWEWDPCTILETRQAKILFQDHKVLEDGTVQLTPLSMVLHSKSRIVDGVEIPSPPIVLRAPNGARLKFERPLTAGGDVGDLENGQLIGDVQIFRPASETALGKGKDDSLYLETQNVQISPERIFTLYDCDFRFGESYGRGKHLTVDLFGPSADEDGNVKTFAGVERIELGRIHELYLHRQGNSGSQIARASTGTESDILGNTNSSFLVHCKGPMHFDIPTRNITFQDRVQIRPAVGDGDQLNCEKLTVIFSTNKTDRTSDQSPGSIAGHAAGRMQVTRLIAEGTDDSPAIIASASQNARISARTIDYDLVKNHVSLTSNDEVIIVRNGQQIRAREVQYSFLPDGRIGNAVMLGPGVISQPGEQGKGQVICHWQTKLTLQQDGDKKVLSFDNARIQMDVTTVHANQVHFWMWEIPDATDPDRKKWKLEPAKMFATGRVQIESPELSGTCTEAAAFWPTPLPSNAQVEYRTTPRVYVSSQRPRYISTALQEEGGQSPSWQGNQQHVGQITWHPKPHPNQQAIHWQGEQTASAVQPAGYSQGTRKQKTFFEGGQVQLQMRGGKHRGEVQELTVDESVVVQQKQSHSDGSTTIPLEIRGQKLRVVSQPGERYRMHVTGTENAPATVAMDQLRMVGIHIHLDQAANRLWIEGPGEMHATGGGFTPTTAAPPLQSNGQTTAPQVTQGETSVSWIGGMVFDGQTIYFETEVASKSRQTDREDSTTTTTASQSAALSITLDQFVNFSQIESRESTPSVKATRLVMVGSMRDGDVAFPDYWKPSQATNVWVAVGKYDNAGKITSNQEIVATRATFDVTNGSVKCIGPGSVTARQLAKSGSSTRLASTGGRRNGALDFIKVDFETDFVGNMESSDLKFVGNVHTFYSDTNRWDHSPPESSINSPGSRGVIMDCDQLALAQWTPKSSEETIDLIATGNARIKGGQFNATAERISYFQGNGQVVMDAPTRSDSEIWFIRPGQTNKGHLVAKTISYNVDSGEYQVQEMKQIEYSQQGPVRGQRKRSP